MWSLWITIFPTICDFKWNSNKSFKLSRNIVYFRWWSIRVEWPPPCWKILWWSPWCHCRITPWHPSRASGSKVPHGGPCPLNSLSNRPPRKAIVRATSIKSLSHQFCGRRLCTSCTPYVSGFWAFSDLKWSSGWDNPHVAAPSSSTKTPGVYSNTGRSPSFLVYIIVQCCQHCNIVKWSNHHCFLLYTVSLSQL